MKNLFLLFFALFVVSCVAPADYYKSTVEPFLRNIKNEYKPQVFDGVMEPAFPDLETDQKTLEGIDANHDGVRDDLEIFINRNFSTWIEREGLKNTVRRSLVLYKNYETMSPQDFVVFHSNIFVDNDCVLYGLKMFKLKQSKAYRTFSPAEAIYNTESRSEAYSYRYPNGSIYGSEYGDKKIFADCTLFYEQKLSQLKNAK